LSNLKKILVSLLVIGGVSSMIGASAGTFAGFTATTNNPNNTFATGTLTMNTSKPAAAILTLSNMIPGDTVSDVVNILSTGTEDMTYTLTTTATTSSVLDTNTTDGLKLWIQRCSQAWTNTGAAATCGGQVADVVGTSGSPVPIIGSNIAMGKLCDSDADGQRTTRGNNCLNSPLTIDTKNSDFLKIRVSLPSSADDTFQGKTSTIQFTWNGAQVTGGNF
jgi:spore coat-associated protein N